MSYSQLHDLASHFSRRIRSAAPAAAAEGPRPRTSEHLWLARERLAVPGALLLLALSLQSAYAQEGGCCDARLAYTFSTERVSSAVPFAGSLGVDPGAPDETCAADAELVIEVDGGEIGAAGIYLNVVSQLGEGARGVQGWSAAVSIEGEGAIQSATQDGTAADLVPQGYRDPNGDFTCTCRASADNPENGGLSGVLSAAILGTTQPAFLPPLGTESILKLAVASLRPQDDDDQVAVLRLSHDLAGDFACRRASGGKPFFPCIPSNGPQHSVFTVEGASERACNLETASLRLVFRRKLAAPGFLRGDCNSDGEVRGLVTDAVFLLNFNFVGGPRPGCLAACDSNGDGAVVGVVTDAVYLLTYNFLGGPPPVAPFPDCGPGEHEGDEALGCATPPEACAPAAG